MIGKLFWKKKRKRALGLKNMHVLFILLLYFVLSCFARKYCCCLVHCCEKPFSPFIILLYPFSLSFEAKPTKDCLQLLICVCKGNLQAFLRCTYWRALQRLSFSHILETFKKERWLHVSFFFWVSKALPSQNSFSKKLAGVFTKTTLLFADRWKGVVVFLFFYFKFFIFAEVFILWILLFVHKNF